MMESSYKTPLKKLVKYFESSRDSWKKRAQDAAVEAKLKRNRIKFLEESKAKLKQENLELKQRLSELESSDVIESTAKKTLATESVSLILGQASQQNHILHHSYDSLLITMWCQLILAGAISLRAASRVLAITLPQFNPEAISIPSWHTGRLWLMRLGYYKLKRAKDIADDWIWIIDHSVQTGTEKCLMILGIRLKDLPKDRSLAYEDVEPIEMFPVTQSNGAIVYEQLEAVVEKTGVPRAIVGDYGSYIKSGIEKFCLKHQGTVYIYDVKHKMAAMLKKVLCGNKRWEMFISLASKTKQQLQQTPLGALVPPSHRSKARYMNTEYLLGWGKNMLSFTSQSDEVISQQGYVVSDVKNKLGWIWDFHNEIDCWTDLLDITSITENFIRNEGVVLDGESELSELFNTKTLLSDSAVTLQFKQDVLDFVKNESQKAKLGERLLGSSEIIESVFGKQKFIEKEQSKSGFTGLLLTLGAIVSKTTADVVKQAMESTPTKTIREWYKEHIKKSLQAKRIDAFNLSVKTA